MLKTFRGGQVSGEWTTEVATMSRQDFKHRNIFHSAATDMTNVLFFPRKICFILQWHKQLVIKSDMGLKEGPSWRPHLGGTHIIGSHIWDWFTVSWPGAEPTVLSGNWRRLMELVCCGSRHPPHPLLAKRQWRRRRGSHTDLAWERS